VENQSFIELQQNLAKMLKEARVSRGLSQEALALEAGVDRSYVSQLERGIANPSLYILSKIAQVLCAKLELLIDLND